MVLEWKKYKNITNVFRIGKKAQSALYLVTLLFSFECGKGAVGWMEFALPISIFAIFFHLKIHIFGICPLDT